MHITCQPHFAKGNPACDAFALPTALLVMAVVAVLSLAVLYASSSMFEQVWRKTDSVRAVNIARAGLQIGLAHAMRGRIEHTLRDAFAGGWYVVETRPQPKEDHEILLTATGHTADGGTASVQAVADTKTGTWIRWTQSP